MLLACRWSKASAATCSSRAAPATLAGARQEPSTRAAEAQCCRSRQAMQRSSLRGSTRRYAGSSMQRVMQRAGRAQDLASNDAQAGRRADNAEVPQQTDLRAGMMQSSSTSSQAGGSSSCMAACRGSLRNHCSKRRWLGVAAAAQPHRMWHRGSTAIGSGRRTLQAVLHKLARPMSDPNIQIGKAAQPAGLS